MTSLRVKEIPVRSAAGMMNKLAMECSKPMPTKVEMGNLSMCQESTVLDMN